jgi:glycosyltransferase involved in cell wall biosynthesis
MKILLVTNYQPPHMGGIEFAAASLKRCWEQDGYAVTWLSTDLPPGGQPKTPDNLRIPAWNFPEERLQINTPLIPPWHYAKVAAAVRAADVVNVHSLAPGLSNVALRAAWRLGKPVVVTQHVAIIPLRWPWLSAYQRRHVLALARGTIARGGLLTFVGQAVRDWFVREGQLDESRIHMTPAGIDQDTYHFVPDEERQRCRAKWELDDARLNVLFVGRFYDKKGLPLIRDLAVLCPAAQFTLVGSGPIQPAAWGLPNVRVIPFVSSAELRELYGAHDLFLMPSYGEGWPAVVPQAMACGLPCLISEECFQGYQRDPDRFLVRRREVRELAQTLQAPARPDRAALSAYAAATWDWQRTARIYSRLFMTAKTA